MTPNEAAESLRKVQKDSAESLGAALLEIIVKQLGAGEKHFFDATAEGDRDNAAYFLGYNAGVTTLGEVTKIIVKYLDYQGGQTGKAIDGYNRKLAEMTKTGAPWAFMREYLKENEKETPRPGNLYFLPTDFTRYEQW